MAIHFDTIIHSSKNGKFSSSPFIQICLKKYSQDEDDNVIISPNLMSSEEFENFCNQLISELGELKLEVDFPKN